MIMMDVSEEIKAYNKRWKIQDDSNYQEKFEKFRTAVLNILTFVDDDLGAEECKVFCNINGLPFELPRSSLSDHPGFNVRNALRNETNEKKFYFLIQLIFMNKTRRRKICYKYFDRIKEIALISEVNLALTIHEDDNRVIFYPKGEEKLDEILIDSIFSFLDIKSSEKFKEALVLYEEQEYIRSAESIRRCLEEFLRCKFKNTMGLVANISLLSKQLKEIKQPELKNIICTTFKYLDNFFNEQSKHNDGELSEAENEFLLYQSSVLMRYISKK